MTEILITSSVLILALLLLRKLFAGSLSRRVQYALWGLVLLRLLIPVNLPAINFSVLTAAKPVEKTVTQTITEQPIYVPVAQAPLEEHPLARRVMPQRTPIEVGQSVWIAQEKQQTAVQYKRISPQAILFWVWFAGCVTAAALLFLTNLRFWLWLRRVRKPYEVEDCKLRVYLVETGLPAPCLFGLFRPAIYLTSGAVESPETLRHVLAHETTHARHLDHLWTFLRGVCLALYWFDPLVWAAAAAAKADCELACDEGALARLEEADRIPYGETLLSLAVVREAGNPMLAATAMTTGKKHLKERITRIAHKSRQTIAAIVAMALLVGAVSACTFTDAGPGPLRICIDAGVHVNCIARNMGTVDQGAAFLGRRLITEFGMDEEDFEFDIIPAEGSARAAALARVRAEIMSGEGPDVFLCACADAAISPREGLQDRTDATLFPFPERAMEDGVFLPLDEYIEQAEYMEWDKMLPNVTAAGKTEQGQMVIPISYRMRMTAYQEGDAEPYPADTSFADVLASDDDILRSTTAFTYQQDHRNDSAFPYLFTDLADYKTGELLFTEDDLYRMIQDVEALFHENLAGLPSGTSPKFQLPQTDLPPHFSEALDLDTYDGYYVVTDPEKEGFIYINYHVMLYMQDPRRGFTGSTEQVMLPLYNVDGGATALVASFGAVNANTRQPEKAFAVLDYMLSRYAQHECVLYTFLCENALPVHMEMGMSNILTPGGSHLRSPYSIMYRLGFDSQAFRAYAAVREQIGYARFSTLLDQELAVLVTEYSAELNEQSEENLRKMISESYAKMKRILDES